MCQHLQMPLGMQREGCQFYPFPPSTSAPRLPSAALVWKVPWSSWIIFQGGAAVRGKVGKSLLESYPCHMEDESSSHKVPTEACRVIDLTVTQKCKRQQMNHSLHFLPSIHRRVFLGTHSRSNINDSLKIMKLALINRCKVEACLFVFSKSLF